MPEFHNLSLGSWESLQAQGMEGRIPSTLEVKF